jgi:hypothetical protein
MEDDEAIYEIDEIDCFASLAMTGFLEECSWKELRIK